MEKKRIKKLYRKLAVPAVVLVMCLVVAGVAGIVLAADDVSFVTLQADTDTLAKTLLGEEMTYKEAKIISSSEQYQYATFTGLMEEDYGFSDGIILCNGDATKVMSRGASRTDTIGTSHEKYKDASDIEEKAFYRLYEKYDSFCKLAGEQPSSIKDGAVFAMKVVPTTNALSFRYFFASDEYRLSAEYNDPFGLWVVQDFGGAGEKWNDIAKIPEDRIPEGALSNEVNIQNTCPGCHKSLKYTHDIPGIYKANLYSPLCILGCTEPLDAEIDTLTPGEPVWVVMAVADAKHVYANSMIFVKAASMRFAKASEVCITYDANGGGLSSGDGLKSGVNLPPGSNHTVGEGIEDPVWDGYIFDGWYSAAEGGERVSGSIKAEADITYYAHWKPVTSTVSVPVKKDGGTMPAGTVVELRKDGKTVNTLTKSGTAWTSSDVKNGVYQVFVDGKDAERSVTVKAASSGKTFSVDEINYYTVTADVTLDGSAWQGQTVALSDGTLFTGSGPYTAVLREKASGNSYTVLVNGESKGTVTATAEGNKSVTAAYYMIQVTVNDTTPWTDASVILRKGGTDAHRLAYNSTTRKYEKVLPAADTSEYRVFIDGRDVGKTVSAAGKTADVTFYTASVKITGGFANMPVAITGTGDSYALTGGNTSGTAYTCRHVLKRDNNGYTITVSGTTGTVTDKVTGAGVVNLSYRTVTFKNAGGTTHATQYVLNGKQAQSVTAPVKEGSVFLGWSATSGSSVADYQWSTAVTANKTLYPVYETAGIRLGAHIQTGNTSAYTYQMPNLTVRGYQSVSSVVLKVTNCSDVTVGSGMTKKAALDTGGNGTIILTFNSAATSADAQTKLRGMTVKVKDAKKNHTIQATVYGTQY